MPDWLNTLLNLVSQLTGGRGGIDHVIVNYVVAALIWSSLLAVAVARYREDHRSRERILIWGFSLVLGRELFMIFMAGLQAFKLADPVTLHAIFPPLEHALHDLGIITVAGAFMIYLIAAAAPGRRYLFAGIASTVACYLATFWWWADFITANPASKFGQTWADWLFRINGAVWMLVVAVSLWRRTQGWERNAVCAAMTALFMSTALKIPDMALGEVYENVFTPIMRLFYLGGTLMLGYVFIREQFQERRAHARSLEEVIRNREQLLAELGERKRHLRLFVEHSPAAIAMFDRDMRYLVASRRWLSDYNLGVHTIIGRTHYEVFPDLPERWKEIHRRCLAGAIEKCEEEPFPRADGTTEWVRWEIRPWHDAQGAIGGIILFSEVITARKQAEAIVACQTKVLGLIASGTPLTETLTVMLQSMEAFAPGMLCSVLLLDADGQRVRHGAAPSLPEAFNRAVDGQRIGAGAGSCGTAAFRREAVIVEDIATDPLWVNYRELALAHGLRACWSTPIFDAQQRVLGTFAIYYREPGRPTEQHQRCIAVATHLAAVAIGKQRADAALRESESRHRRLVESNIIGVMIANTDGRITESNALFLRTVGYTREDLEAGRVRWDAMTPPEWRAVDEHILRELSTVGICQPVEKEYLRKDGTRVPILASVAMLEGTPGACICLIADMTERKRAEAERQKFVQLAESSSEFIGMCDLDFKPLYVNPAGVRMVGLPDLDAACRVKVPDYFFPEDQPFITEEFFPRVLREGHGEVEIRLRHFQSGEPIWMSYYLFQVRDARGAVIGWATVSRDITERKHAEAALRESEARFAAAFRANPAGVVLSTLAEGRFLDVNPAFLEMFSFTREQVVGRTSVECGVVVSAEARHTIVEEVRRAGFLRDLEMPFQRPDGSTCHTLRSVERLVLGGEECLLTLIVDTTERKRAAEQLAEANEQLRALLARLQRAREEERIRVSREIHDELGQLLTGLKMDVRWLERKLSEPGVPAALNPLLERAVAASELADTTIATVQKIAAELRPGTLDNLGLEAALQQKARSFQERTGTACTFVVAEASPDLPAAIAGELFYICQEALTNVARHAHATKVEIHLRPEGDGIVLEVRDDGVGMAEAELHAPRSLGLLGMRERAVQCGGTVTFTRNEPRGTRVTVRVPKTATANRGEGKS